MAGPDQLSAASKQRTQFCRIKRLGLKQLYLGGTKITDAGLERLKEALPRCYIDISTEGVYSEP